MSVKRFDSATIGKIEKTPQGGLKVQATPTSAGVFVYRNADGSERRELRSPEEVFRPDSLRSLAGAPLTHLHPLTPVNPANWKELAVGHLSEDIRRDGDCASTFCLVQDAEQIKRIDSGEARELSCGYSCNILETPGIHPIYGPYDVYQTDIFYNHCGMGPVGWGRQGSSVAIRLDANDAIQVETNPVKPEAERKIMKTVRIDGIEYDIGTESHLQAVARRDAAQTSKLADAESKIEALTKERDSLSGRADAAEKQIVDLSAKLKAAQDPKTIQAAAKKRADMLDNLRQIFRAKGQRFDAAKEAEAAAASDDDQMIMAIQTMDPDFKPEGKSPDFIKGYFASLFKGMSAQIKSNTQEEQDEPLSAPPGAPGNAAPPGAPRTDAHNRTPHDARRGNGTRTDSEDERQDAPEPWEQPLQASKDR